MTTLANKINPKHYALMDLMVLEGGLNDAELARRLGFNKQWVSKALKDSTFCSAFENYRKKMEDAVIEKKIDLLGLAVEVTQLALKKSKEILEKTDMETPISVKQVTIKDVLAQGHAKAVERKAEIQMRGEITPEMLQGLVTAAQEFQIPFVPVKRLKRGGESEEGKV